MTVVSSMKEKLLAHLRESIVGTVGLSLLAGLLWGEDRVAQFLPPLQPVWSVRAIAAICILLCLSLVSFFYYRPKFKFDEPTGTLTDVKTGIRYCTHCVHTFRNKVPLKNEEYRWRCMVCGTSYRDPARTPATPPPPPNAYATPR